MTMLIKATLTIEAPGNLSAAELKRITQDIEELELLDKLFGATRELLRERVTNGHRLAVFLE